MHPQDQHPIHDRSMQLCLYRQQHGMVKDDGRDIIKTLCSYKKAEIIAGAVCTDHVPLYVSIPPKLSVSDFVGYIKGKSTLMIFDKHPELGSNWIEGSRLEGTILRETRRSGRVF